MVFFKQKYKTQNELLTKAVEIGIEELYNQFFNKKSIIDKQLKIENKLDEIEKLIKRRNDKNDKLMNEFSIILSILQKLSSSNYQMLLSI